MKRLLSLLAALLLLVPIGCRTEQPHSAVGYACDTVVTITAYAPQKTVDEALTLCTAYESVLSKTRENSDIYALNHAGGAPVTVQNETVEVLRLALEIGERSGGAFDVTIAPLSALWDFRAEEPSVPDARLLSEAGKRVDYQNVTIEGNTVTLQNGTELDLGGVAKGYIADRVAEYLTEQGVSAFCINMGGNVVTHGRKPNGALWTIGIRDPNGTPEQSEEVLSAENAAIVTSGNYERFFLLDGVRYHHILDPKTGMPVQNGLASVTIVGTESALCDALSTACFVLGEQAGVPLLNHYDVRAIFLYENGTRSEYPPAR